LQLIHSAAYREGNLTCICGESILQPRHRGNGHLSVVRTGSPCKRKRIFQAMNCGRSGHKRGMIVFSASAVKNHDPNFPVQPST